jgi:tetratricopeptide (TPR) repeat protein
LLTESLVSVAIDDQRWSEAETLAKRALEMRHHAGVYDNLAMALEAQGRDVEAAAAAAEVFELNPKLQVQRIQQILRLAARLRDENLAILATRHWIEREPRNPAPLALLKQIEASQNRPTTAPSEGMP